MFFCLISKERESAGQFFKEGWSSWNNILDKQGTHLITRKHNDCDEAAMKLLERSEKPNKHSMLILMKLNKNREW